MPISGVVTDVIKAVTLDQSSNPIRMPDWVLFFCPGDASG